MALIYNISIYFYHFLIRIFSLFDTKAKLWIKGRKDWKDKLQIATQDASNIYWFHAASLGEFEQGRPLIEKIKSEQKDVFILLTFFSPSGYEIQKKYAQADYICYLPIDTKRNASEFITIVNPKKVFFIKYEFWFNHMRLLKQNKVPLYLISGIFREHHIFFKPYGQWFRKQLQAFTYFYVQDQKSVDKLKAIGYENTLQVGDTRFDRVVEIAEQSFENKLIEEFVSNIPCLIIGSSWPKDEEILSEYINAHPNYKYILAPHEIDEAHLETIDALITLPKQRYSKYKIAPQQNLSVLLIDNIGMLSFIYKYADIAYVGGAFGTGLHNILEAAVYQIPVVFGPEYSKFSEAIALLEENGAFSISNYQELEKVLEELFIDESKRKTIGGNAKHFIYKSKGSVNRIYINIFSEKE